MVLIYSIYGGTSDCEVFKVTRCIFDYQQLCISKTVDHRVKNRMKLGTLGTLCIVAHMGIFDLVVFNITTRNTSAVFGQN